MKTDRIDADKAAPDPRFFPASLINGALGAALLLHSLEGEDLVAAVRDARLGQHADLVLAPRGI